MSASASPKKRGRPANPSVAERATPHLMILAAVADDLQKMVDGGIQPVCAQQMQLDINNLKQAAHDIANVLQATVR